MLSLQFTRELVRADFYTSKEMLAFLHIVYVIKFLRLSKQRTLCYLCGTILRYITRDGIALQTYKRGGDNPYKGPNVHEILPLPTFHVKLVIVFTKTPETCFECKACVSN